MWFNGIAKWSGGLAHYDIIQQKDSIYQAVLNKYDGRPDKKPPSDFILTKGLRCWTGSINDQSLLDQIGEVIDKRLHGRLYNQIMNSELPIANRR